MTDRQSDNELFTATEAAAVLIAVHRAAADPFPEVRKLRAELHSAAEKLRRSLGRVLGATLVLPPHKKPITERDRLVKRAINRKLRDKRALAKLPGGPAPRKS